MSTLTPAEIQQALAENSASPHGSARNVRAEELSAAAERSGDRALFRRALSGLIDAYEYSAERTKMTVPFARLLQEYDRDPSTFEAFETHGLFWRFKWVAGRIVEAPEIPIDAVERWLVDMERRYRLAGYSERAVRQAEFYLADAIGDDARTDRAMARWAAADRDRMSDCHACEISTQGWYWSRKQEDLKAIEVWQPVLAGQNTCMEEPHRTLAHSLLPLVRLGRPADARAHHLRGYRMARGKESLLRSIGRHIEFCALTGNESRGLEILTEHAVHLGPLPDVESQMDFNGGILVLLRRLTDLGHGDQPAASYQGTSRTVSELYDLLHTDATAIAARFDVRNGSSHVSDRLVERINGQPLTNHLPLGVRSALLPVSAAPTRPARVAAPPQEADIPELAQRARSMREQGHPGAEALWDRITARLEATGRSADPVLAADLMERRALNAARAGEETAQALLADSLAAHREVGQLGRAALAQLRLATAAAQFGAQSARVRALLGAAIAAAAALDPADPARIRRTATAELTRIRIEAFLRARDEAESQEPDGFAEPEVEHSPTDARLVEELTGFVAGLADADPADGLASVVAEAELMLAEVASRTGDRDRAERLLDDAAQRSLAAGRPWDAVEPLARRASLLFARGAVGPATETARSAVEHAEELTDPQEQAAVRLTLADILLRGGERPEEAADHALDAAHWFDLAGLGAAGGAQARLVLAKSYAAAGRKPEAAEILQSALPDLLEHGPYRAVHARETLGGLLRGLGDARAAAEQFLLAAETAKDWDDPRPQAHFAQLAAEALSASGLRAEAEAAFGRALQLWQEAGDNPVSEVRVLRSLAWFRVETEEDGRPPGPALSQARKLMDQALAVLAGSEEPELRYERGQTWQQLAEIIMEQLYDEHDEEDEDEDGGATGPLFDPVALKREAVHLWERAADIYASLGPDTLRERVQCLHRAAWTERELGRTESAVNRMTTLAGELASQGGEEAKGLLSRVEATLKQWS